MRDKTGFKSNFDGVIETHEETINIFENAMQSGKAAQERFEDLKGAILKSNLEITIANYSKGSEKKVIVESLLKTIAAFEDVFKWGVPELRSGKYDELIWILSLCVLCDVSKQDFQRVTNIVKRDNIKDKLLDFIIHSQLKDEWPITSYSYEEPHPYKNVDNLSSGSEIKQYLNKVWYQNMKEAYFYDAHKETKVNVYFGYWAWETAAIAKIKKIDDSDLKDQKYYPYDAVHW